MKLVSDGLVGPVGSVVVWISLGKVGRGEATIAMLTARATGQLCQRGAVVEEACPDVATAKAVQGIGVVAADLEAGYDAIVWDGARAEVAALRKDVLGGHSG